MNPVYTFQAYQFDEASYPWYVRAEAFNETFGSVPF